MSEEEWPRCLGEWDDTKGAVGVKIDLKFNGKMVSKRIWLEEFFGIGD